VGDIVGVTGVEVTEGRGEAVADDNTVIWIVGTAGGGGIKLHDEKNMANNTK
jgi:hypothetical protein